MVGQTELIKFFELRMGQELIQSEPMPSTFMIAQENYKSWFTGNERSLVPHFSMAIPAA